MYDMEECLGLILINQMIKKYEYVRDVYSTILIRDLVEKYKIRNKQEFTSIAEFMIDNIGNYYLQITYQNA